MFKSVCLKTTSAVKCGRPENDERCSKLFLKSGKSTDVNNSGTETSGCVGGSKITSECNKYYRVILSRRSIARIIYFTLVPT